MYTFDSVFLSKYILFKSNEKLQRYNLRTFRVIITPEKMVHSDFHRLVGLLNCKGIDVVRCNIVIPCTIIRHVRWIGGYRLLLLIMRDVTANKHARSRADIATLYSETMLLGIRYEREKKLLKKKKKGSNHFCTMSRVSVYVRTDRCTWNGHPTVSHEVNDLHLWGRTAVPGKEPDTKHARHEKVVFRKAKEHLDAVGSQEFHFVRFTQRLIRMSRLNYVWYTSDHQIRTMVCDGIIIVTIQILSH